jgi:hypothetical protein
MKRDYWLYGVAFLSGVVVWSLVTAMSGKREAWDSELYFTLGIPAVCLVAGILGFVEPQRPWRWGIVPLAGQFVWMLVTQGVGNLLPLGIIAFGLFAIPSVVTAKLGSVFARWMAEPTVFMTASPASADTPLRQGRPRLAASSLASWRFRRESS